MQYTSKAVEKVIHELSKLPGVGRKSAQRQVFYLLKAPKEQIEQLAQALLELKTRVLSCSICFNITEEDPCPICTDTTRNRNIICVVEEPNDVLAVEKTGEYRGLYHVLGGRLSPLDGIGPDDLHIKSLLNRLTGDVREVILATNPNAEGEATAVYLAKLIHVLNVKTTKIARGIPVGADLEYADEITLSKALEGRIEI